MIYGDAMNRLRGNTNLTDGTVAVLASESLIESLSHAFGGVDNLVAMPNDSSPERDDVDSWLRGIGAVRAVVVEIATSVPGPEAPARLTAEDELRPTRTLARWTRTAAARLLADRRGGALVCVVRCGESPDLPNRAVCESVAGFVRSAGCDLARYGISIRGVLVGGGRPQLASRAGTAPLAGTAQLVRILIEELAGPSGEIYLVTDPELGRISPPTVERELVRADHRLRATEVAGVLPDRLGMPGPGPVPGPDGSATGDMTNRVAIVTGGGGGIGRAVASGLAAHGVAVVVADLGCDPDGRGRDPAPAEDTAREISRRGGQAIALCADVSRPDGCRDVVERTVRAFGRVDVLCHAAGVVRPALVFDSTDEEWDSVLDVHVAGAEHLIRTCLDPMRRQRYGRIILFSSRSVAGSPGHGAYAAAKGAVLALGRSVAAHVAGSGVSANVVLPSGRTRASMPSAPTARQRRVEILRARHHGIADPLAYRNSPEQDPENNVALINWLCTEQAAAVNGRIFGTGGWHVDLYRPSAVAVSVPLPRVLTAADVRALSTG